MVGQNGLEQSYGTFMLYQKDERTAICKLCKKYINIECMGFAALKQHSKKLKHWGFSSHLIQSLMGHETEPKADTGIEKDTEKSQKPVSKLISQSIFSSSSERTVQPPKKDMCQDALSPASSSTHEEVWTVKQQVIKGGIIATLQFASQNMPSSAEENLAMYFHQQFPDSVIAKSVANGPHKMSYCRSWFSLEQNCWFIEDKLSSTAVDFIRSEGIAERQHLIWGKASSLSMPRT